MKILQRVSHSYYFVLVTVGAIAIAPSALASGFALNEQSVRGLGNAFAGSVAVSDDASTIFYNPAGLTNLPDNSVMGAAYYISPTVRFNNEGSTTAIGTPINGGDGGDGGDDAFVPNFYAAWSVSDRIKLGIGVNAPFGLATEYDRDWVGRYQAVESRLTTVNINPTVAAKITDDFSIGAGVNFQYANAKLSNAIDFGAIGLGAGLSTLPQSADGFVEVEGNDWSFGYNLGLLYAPTDETRIGLAYRSGIDHNLEGDADFITPPGAAPLTATGAFADTDAEATLKTPDSLGLGFYQKVTPKIALLADVTWTNWSQFEELRVRFDNPAQPDSVQPENWEDTFRLSVGVNYAATEELMLRAGVAYDQSPVSNRFRTPRIPDSDRIWLALGASYELIDSLSLDFGYAHLFVDDGAIDEVSSTGDRLRGNVESDVDIFGLQLNWRF
jgi:long-chain fatty acid transport protein